MNMMPTYESNAHITVYCSLF